MDENIWGELEELRRVVHGLGQRVTTVESENAELKERVAALEALAPQSATAAGLTTPPVSARRQRADAPPA